MYIYIYICMYVCMYVYIYERYLLISKAFVHILHLGKLPQLGSYVLA